MNIFFGILAAYAIFVCCHKSNNNKNIKELDERNKIALMNFEYHNGINCYLDNNNLKERYSKIENKFLENID